jgi:hypothetical protein
MAVIVILALSSCAPAAQDAEREQANAACPALFGEYAVMSMRRASDVAGGPDDPAAAEIALNDTVSFRDELVWLGGESCAAWSVSESSDPVTNLDDPMLADVIVAADGGLLSETERSGVRHYELLCDEATIGVATQTDARILVAPTASGLTYVILEKPLPADAIAALQSALKARGFYSGEANSMMDNATQQAVSRYAASLGGYEAVFARSAITGNLLASLGVEAKEDCTAPASDSIEARFPDYRPKLGEDAVLDYRPGLAAQLAELPAATRDNFQRAYVALGDLNRNAAASPGRWDEGNIALGAEPQEYVPSDQELLAAELGDQLAALVETMTVEDIMEAWDGAALVPPPTGYNRFEFRHVDVMGSGRFFYASPPEYVTIDIPPRPETP